MSEQELALGQREIVDGIEFTEPELDLMAKQGVTPEECVDFVKNTSKQTINAAIGGVLILKAGKGQERNEPFSEPAPEAAPEAPAEAEKPADEAAPVEGEAPTDEAKT